MAGGTSHFYSFFSVNILARVDFFGMTTLAFGLASQAQAKIPLHMTKLLAGHEQVSLKPMHKVQDLDL